MPFGGKKNHFSTISARSFSRLEWTLLVLQFFLVPIDCNTELEYYFALGNVMRYLIFKIFQNMIKFSNIHAQLQLILFLLRTITVKLVIVLELLILKFCYVIRELSFIFGIQLNFCHFVKLFFKYALSWLYLCKVLCNVFFLFRFYNHDSSFLHGGLDRPGQETRPVVGQQVRRIFFLSAFSHSDAWVFLEASLY